MHSDLKLILEFSDSADMCVGVRDRNSLIEIISSQNKSAELNFKFSVPNQLLFDVTGTGNVTLKRLALGGLDLPTKILDQICHFTPIDSETSIVITQWAKGKVNIDFFAADWVQYHLLYGNKILL